MEVNNKEGFMGTGHSIVFYSWQSDLPNATNRGFIEEALKRAVKTIQNDDSIITAPRLERDTLGIPGSPDISQTIFDKIEQADVFVCDVSIINTKSFNERQDRPTPNPNVLIELGYALKKLGPHRVIMVLNAAYGEPELLPFDLRMRRVLRYLMPDKANERASERKRLEGILTESIRTILRELSVTTSSKILESKPLVEQICLAITEGHSTQEWLCRQYMKDFAKQIVVLAPQLRVASTVPQDERLIQSIGNSTSLVLEFLKLAQIIAIVETSQKAAMALYKGFENILALYTYPPSSNPSAVNEGDHDFAKFLGHEVFVAFFAFLIQEERWELMADLFEEDFYVRIAHFGQPEHVNFTVFSQPIRLLRRRAHRLKLQNVSPHSDLLMKRYREGKLKNALSFESFMASDYLLYLRGAFQLDEQYQLPDAFLPAWPPWSTFYMHRLPDYLYKAERRKYAEQLLVSLDIQDIPSLSRRVKKATEDWENLWGKTRRLEALNFNAIGSRP
ncbi:nucleotide-binding protein [Ktedonospora formicarum]|uniref:CD-NTase-associated protein 12/Pycsar effector protein TIR domain-containing protein n=1 Tax=Ktedonospora formicarum TaxID=2778364 RepID=A0A8J3IGJ6_9CHLR|nr:nucleotide-binding protein [Ktedonospora formicarum]GHO51439.1 hypothetical protein KSX_96020 [Ktedonospora formicarum]